LSIFAAVVVQDIRDQDGGGRYSGRLQRGTVVSAVHLDVSLADRRVRPLRFRVRRGPKHGVGDQYGHWSPVGHGLSSKGDGTRSSAARHNVHGAAADGQRPYMVVHHVHVRLQSVRRRSPVHRSVYVGRGPAGDRRGGTQTVPDHSARYGHR